MRINRVVFFLRILIFFSLFSLFDVSAQSPSFKVNDLRFETRVDFDNRYQFYTSKNEGGFGGKYLNFVLNGSFTPRLNYSYRQRFNVPMQTASSFFKATDWAYLTYAANENITLSAGKQVVAIGGIEYDMAPIDVYFWSDFWNNVICYEMGASVSLHDTEKRHLLTFQFSNSPFIETHSQHMYAYNLIWYGNFKHFKPIYSVNMLEYEKGRFINYIALGNRWVFDRFSFFVDYMNRASFSQDDFFSNFTVKGKVAYDLDSKLTIFAKGGVDLNNSQASGLPLKKRYDRFVAPGTEFYYCGVGAEYFPFKESRDVRIHSFLLYRSYNAVETIHFNVGLTWKFNLLKALERRGAL